MRVAAVIAAVCALATEAQGAARFAIVAGNNRGAQGRALLWFAERDAERFSQALQELGDFGGDRVVLLQGAGAKDVRASITQLEARIAAARAAGERALLVFYFSGHAGAGGLELGDERITYDELRGLLAGSAAETRVGIVDACEAGELTQVKGARSDPTVGFALPADDTVQGTALIASTAVGESAQESAALGGSFFTHHLEIGLRGAGDFDGDGRVTLAEAFRYTALRTVAGTASTRAGPQHPTYDFRMSGRGDIVLAELRRGDGSLHIPADADAQYVVRGPRELFAEVPGTNEGTTLALPSGPYVVERRGGGGLSVTEFTLSKGEKRELPVMRKSPYLMARAKGGGIPLVWFASGGVASFPMPGLGPAPIVRAGARQDLGPIALRFRAGYLRGSGGPAGLPYALQVADFGLAALWEAQAGPILLEAGPELSGGVAFQSLTGATHSVGEGAFGGVAMATLRAGSTRLGLDLGVSGHVFRLDGQMAVRPGGALSFVVLYSP